MGTCYNHLTFTDRLQIEAWQKAGISKAQMAELLGVHLSTIYRELMLMVSKEANNKTQSTATSLLFRKTEMCLI